MTGAESARRRRARMAWGIVAGFSLLVLFLGSSRFNVAETGGILAPLLDLLFPDLDRSQRYLLHLKIRKTAHVIEYGVLALLALRAAFLTFRTATARIAVRLWACPWGAGPPNREVVWSHKWSHKPLPLYAPEIRWSLR